MPSGQVEFLLILGVIEIVTLSNMGTSIKIGLVPDVDPNVRIHGASRVV